MPLAVKNNALILKGGKLAENCGCCEELGCCCVGLSATTNTEEQCAAVGGTWKGYSCNSPPPSSILLTLSLTNYSAYLPRSPTTTSAGTWNFDFQCVSNTMTLVGGPTYTSTFNSVRAAVTVYAGSTAILFERCGCAAPIFAVSIMYATESAVATRTGYPLAEQINCNAGSPDVGNSWALELVPAGFTVDDVDRIVSVPGFCAGQYSIGGTVYGPGGVQCGTYTLGNPLP